MAYTPPTNPEDSYELSPFGFGPFPLPGESVDVAPPHPEGGGYGGVGFLGNIAQGGSPFGLGSYGSTTAGRPRLNISGGYGGDPYGFGPYGGTDVTPPVVSAAISLNGYEVEVYFSEEVDTTNPALTDPTSYTLEPIQGAAPATVLSVHIEKLGSVNLVAGDTIAGALSVVLTHTGTTLGGTYKVHAFNLTDIAGNPILDADASFFAKGDPPTFIVTQPAPDPGDELLVTFSHEMLANAGGYGALASYDFDVAEVNPYPIGLTPTSLTVLSGTQVLIGVKGQTSLAYDLTISKALAFSFDTTDGLVDCLALDAGTATITTAAGYLIVSKERDLAWSREWRDSSGTVVPLTSTLRADCTFDFSSATYSPALSLFASPVVADITVQDGVPGNGRLIRFTLQLSATGTDQIRIRSGTFDVTVDASWRNAQHTISFVRNMQAGIVTFLLDDAPLTSTLILNVDGNPETQASVRFALTNGGWDINGVRIYGCRFSNTTTVFSAAWNFLHDQQASFVGSTVLTRNTLFTQRGPLVKGWGDATPATKQDVTVEVQGTAVEIASVNPYLGEIVVDVPIPLLPVGESDVAVDYKWFKSPVMELSGLNTGGLVLNKYDDPRRGHQDPAAHGDQVQVLPGQPDFLANPGIPKGAVDTHRFPMSVVLGPFERAKPLYIGHRYLGFERAYSALTNSPTTLLLNYAPGQSSVPGFERTVEGVSVAFEGLVKPVDADPGWALDGRDYGGVDHDADTGIDLGTYTVIDSIVGDASDQAATVYHRGAGFSFPASVNLVARFQTSTVLFDDSHPNPGVGASTPILDGVFTGVGFGLHDQRHLYFCGILNVNGVEHVGLLLDPMRQHEWASWEIGPKAILTASSQSRGQFPSSQVPTGFTVGSRFQQISGTQAGVYTATSVVRQSDGTTTVEFTPELPAAWDIYGNKYPEMIFETRASTKPFTYRLDLDTDQQVAELRISGETTGVVVSIDGNVPALPLPAETSLLLPQELVGQVFWGSLSRQAACRATWSFLRYGIVPDQVFLKGHAVVNNTEMDALPENNPQLGGSQWWAVEMFGEAEITANTDNLLLKATSASDSVDLLYAYTRVEPFFSPDSIFDLRTLFRVDTLSDVGLGMELDDTQRHVAVRPLLIRENLSADPTLYRGIVTLPSQSFTGIYDPTDMNFTLEAGSTLAGVHEGAYLVTRQDRDARGKWISDLEFPTGDLTVVNANGRVFEARLAVTSVTPNGAGDTGILFGVQTSLGASQAVVQVEIAGTSGNEVVRLRTATGAPLATYSFDWSDGLQHTYRVLADFDLNTVTVVIDDQVQAPAVALNLFSGGSSSTQVFFGCTGRDIANALDDTIEATVEWYSFHAHVMAPADVKRTIGVLKGRQLTPGFSTNINDYELPRVDTSSALNSWQTGPDIQWWDWRQDIELRIYRDPGWGVTVFRPDLPLPPYYAADEFITESTEPSAGWINVEYHELPRTKGASLGSVAWGDLGPRSISQSRWDWVRYRLFRHPTEDRIAPEHMVLNQYNVMASGELASDRTLETVVVVALDKTRMTLLPTDIYAASVYKILDGATVWTSEHWIFDSASQLVTLQPDPETGVPREFSSEHANLTVMFIPGKPVTRTYLAAQPLLDGVTLLNEGTPPVPKSQTANSEIEIVQGSALNDPSDVLSDDPDFVLNDPHRTLRYKDVEGSYYEDLEFIEVTDDGTTGLLSAICEGGPGQGFSGLAQEEGEDIYSPDGVGAELGGVGNLAGLKATGDKVGKSVGAEVFDFSGTQFWQDTNFLPEPAWSQKGGMSGGILFASGGNFVNPVVDANGEIIPHAWVTGGGTLAPGSAVLYPTFPAKGPAGGDHGRIYQRTDWYMRIDSVLTNSRPGMEAVEQELAETWPRDGWDSTASDGTEHAQGAATGALTTAGDYSRYGPWAGWDSLEPARDSGTWVLLSVTDGIAVRVWNRVGAVWVTFTARNVPVGTEEFLVGPNPHTTLAAIINNHPIIGSQYVATAGLTLSGDFQVMITSNTPSTVSDIAAIDDDSPTTIFMRDVFPGAGGTGILTGGAKIQQSSMLAGGTRTIDATNEHNLLLGMVALGGSVLPDGLQTNLIFTPS